MRVATQSISSATRNRAPFLWFCTTSTAFTRLDLRTCCSSLPIMGFVVFTPTTWRSPAFAGSSDCKRSSQRVSYPSKNPPRLQPHRVTAAVALLPFTTSQPTEVGYDTADPNGLRSTEVDPHTFSLSVAEAAEPVHQAVTSAVPCRQLTHDNVVCRLQGVSPPTSP